MTTAHAMLFSANCNHPGGWPPNPWNLRKQLLVVLVVVIGDYDAIRNLSIYYYSILCCHTAFTNLTKYAISS
jgi:hypothetical protein